MRGGLLLLYFVSLCFGDRLAQNPYDLRAKAALNEFGAYEKDLHLVQKTEHDFIDRDAYFDSTARIAMGNFAAKLIEVHLRRCSCLDGGGSQTSMLPETGFEPASSTMEVAGSTMERALTKAETIACPTGNFMLCGRGQRVCSSRVLSQCIEHITSLTGNDELHGRLGKGTHMLVNDWSSWGSNYALTQEVDVLDMVTKKRGGMTQEVDVPDEADMYCDLEWSVTRSTLRQNYCGFPIFLGFLFAATGADEDDGNEKPKNLMTDTNAGGGSSTKLAANRPLRRGFGK